MEESTASKHQIRGLTLPEDKQHGNGKHSWNDGRSYEGQYVTLGVAEHVRVRGLLRIIYVMYVYHFHRIPCIYLHAAPNSWDVRCAGSRQLVMAHFHGNQPATLRQTSPIEGYLNQGGVLFKGGASLRGRGFFKRGRGGCFFPNFFGGEAIWTKGSGSVKRGGPLSGGLLLKEEEGCFFMGGGGPPRGVQ